MKAEHDTVSVLHVLVQILDLGSKDVRHSGFHRSRYINDGFPLRIRLPHVQDCIADFEGILHLRAVEALRTVLEHKVSVRFVSQLLQKLGAVNSQLFDLFFVLVKDLFALRHGCGVIEMHDRLGSALDRFERLADDVLPCLCEDLDRHIIGDHISLNEGTQKVILCFRCSGETHFDLFEADPDQHLEKLYLLLQAHRLDQRLVSVTQIDTAPDGSSVDVIFFGPIEAFCRGEKILPHVLLVVHIDLRDIKLPEIAVRKQ